MIEQYVLMPQAPGRLRKVNDALLTSLLKDLFLIEPPKSTGREHLSGAETPS